MRCPDCSGFNTTKYTATKGLYTVLNIDSQNQAGTRRVAKLSEKVTMCDGQNFLGELIATVAHRQQGGGHYVCYTRTDDDVWFLNDDSKRVAHTSHPFQSKIKGETPTMLVYKNY